MSNTESVPDKISAISRAVKIAGSQQKVADCCKVTQALVSQWENGARIPIRHFPGISSAACGEVTLQELLADEIAKERARETAA